MIEALQNIDWPMMIESLLIASAIGVLIYHAVSAYYHIRYYVLRRHEPETWKCQPRRFLRPEQTRRAVLLGTFNLTLGGCISGVLIYAIRKGLETPIFFEVADYGWTYTVISTIGYFVLIDALAYYVHRTLHGKFLYRTVHRHHHYFVATSPYVVTALHPVELVSLQFVSLAPIFIFPLHAASIGIVLIYVLIFNIIDHSGVKLTSSLPWQGPSTYHDDHHAHFHCNFGQHLMIWDRLHGTLRRRGRKYGKNVFGGRGQKDPEQDAAVSEFIQY
jgi:lathosterol oxidase